MSFDGLRAALPATGNCHFLNYAATAPLPLPSAEAMAAVARQATEPMAAHFTTWLALVESIRRLAADTISASPEEILFIPNTSTGLSLVAASVRWHPGDRCLYPADEFPSNRYVWQNLADLGVIAEAIPPTPGVDFADQLADRDLTGVRLVALSAVSYRDGRRIDVGAVGKLCRARGILVAVDGIQAVGAVPVDVREWGCDFLACGGQKWLMGPVGSGFLYLAKARLAEVQVPLVGWASSRDAGNFEAQQLEFCDGARRFEPGLLDVTAIAGLGKSVDLLTTTGWQALFARIAEHNNRLCRELMALDLFPLHAGPPATRAGIVAVELPSEEEAEAVRSACERERIIVTQRRRHLRIAAHAATSDADIDAILELLRSICSRGARPSPTVVPSARYLGMGAGSTPSASHRPRWRRALVTGGSRGLGEGIAVALARRGCRLTLIGRDLASLRCTAERLEREYDVDAEASVVDLADRQALFEWRTRRQQEGSPYDVLVNNAAQADAGLFLDTDLERLRTTFETNLFAPLTLTQWLLPAMIERRHGAILNLVTASARCAMPLFSGYAASKGALWAWSESLARELVGTGVTVTTFLPPHMPTTTQRRLGRKALAYYWFTDLSSHLASPLKVGEEAVAALAAGRPFVASLGVRIRLAANLLAPEQVTKRLRQVWRAQRRG